LREIERNWGNREARRSGAARIKDRDRPFHAAAFEIEKCQSIAKAVVVIIVPLWRHEFQSALALRAHAAKFLPNRE